MHKTLIVSTFAVDIQEQAETGSPLRNVPEGTALMRCVILSPLTVTGYMHVKAERWNTWDKLSNHQFWDTDLIKNNRL